MKKVLNRIEIGISYRRQNGLLGWLKRCPNDLLLGFIRFLSTYRIPFIICRFSLCSTITLYIVTCRGSGVSSETQRWMTHTNILVRRWTIPQKDSFKITSEGFWAYPRLLIPNSCAKGSRKPWNPCPCEATIYFCWYYSSQF